MTRRHHAVKEGVRISGRLLRLLPPRFRVSHPLPLLVGVLVTVTLVLPFAGFVRDIYIQATRVPPADRYWEAVQARGVLRVGMDFGTPPFAAAPDGTLGGYTVDLAQDLATRLGVTAAIIETPTDGFYDALRTDRVDLILSTLPPMPAFADIAYSPAYVEIGARIVVRAENALRTPDDLAGKRVGAELGSDGDLALRVLARRVSLTRESDYDSGEAALTALHMNALDAVVMDGIAARRAIAADATLALLPTPVLPKPYVLATRRVAPSLTAHLDTALAAARTEGTLARLDNRWLAHEGYVSHT